MALFEWFGTAREGPYDQGIRAFDDGSYEEAANAFEGCLDETTHHATQRLARFYLSESLSHLAHSALRHGSFERAVRFIERALGQYPNYADLHYSLAFALRKLDKAGAALAAVNKALEINPRFARAVLLQGLLWYEGDSEQDGLRRIEHAATLDESLRNERFELAAKLHEAGDKETASGLFEAVIGRDAEELNGYARVGDEALRSGNHDKAAAEYVKALTVTPKYADLRCRYGLSLLGMGRTLEAIVEFEKALEINSRYADAQFHLARALHKAGRAEEAGATLKRLMEQEPHFPGAQELLDRLIG
ncbi:MAG: tetratricopeptide repeat protein [Armatimonadetes bacterium]|nr:tetratricopeptide repeat protein [Armatimonadota bacterium]